MPATIAATSAAAASNPKARVSVKYSATPKTAAAINHAIHGMKAVFVQIGYLESTRWNAGSTVNSIAPAARWVLACVGDASVLQRHVPSDWIIQARIHVSS